MKINATEKASLNDPITPIIDGRFKPVRCTTTGEWKEHAGLWAEQLGVPREKIYAVCNGALKTCKGLRFSYEENVAEVREAMATELSNKDSEIARLNAIIASMQPDADVGRAIREAEEARLEAERKAKEEHDKAIAKAEKAYNKANAEFECRQRMVERAEAEWQRLAALMTEAEKNRDDAMMHLLVVKGDIKA